MAEKNRSQQRKVFAASAIGTTIEWYDFFVYATAAALVFSTQFFGAMDPSVALLTSMATIGVTFIARPFGSAVVGHFGDKIGRKEMLVLTLALMGVSTFLVGLLPPTPRSVSGRRSCWYFCDFFRESVPAANGRARH